MKVRVQKSEAGHMKAIMSSNTYTALKRKLFQCYNDIFGDSLLC